jgi:hypothetical protein
MDTLRERYRNFLKPPSFLEKDYCEQIAVGKWRERPCWSPQKRYDVPSGAAQ